MQSNKKNNLLKYFIIGFIAFLIASCPLINLVVIQSSQSEKEAQEKFAASKAADILLSVVNDIPFAVLKSGNPASIEISETSNQARYARYNSTWAKETIQKLFGNNVDDSDGKYLCSGSVQDASGTQYLIHLRSEDVLVSSPADAVGQINIGKDYPTKEPNEFPKNQKLTFAFIKNPSLFSNGTWLQQYKPKDENSGQPFLETDLPNKVSESPENLYDSEDFLNPVAERKYPNLEGNNSSCLLKKLILQIQWKDNSGKPVNFHLITIKGNLD